MPALHFTTYIEGPIEKIFALISDITQYDHWLPHSRAFGSVTKVSPIPVGLGTTYVDTGPSGAMQGLITDYQLPTHITFQQSMPVKLLLIGGTLEMHIRYKLEPIGQATNVSREVSFQLPGVLKAAYPLIVSTVRRESKRLLLVVKSYIETQPDKD